MSLPIFLLTIFFLAISCNAQVQSLVRLNRSTASPFRVVQIASRRPSVAVGETRAANSTRSSSTVQKSNLDLLLQSMLSGYDKNERPPAANSTYGPVLVKVNIMIRMLSKIDVVNMEYGMQITLREQWLDRRLAFEKANVTNKPKFLTVPFLASQIWIPDSFFRFIRIFPDGTVLYSVRLSLTCSCPMFLALYPLDVQHCDFDLISYAFTTRDIVYEWDTSGEPVQKKLGVGGDLPNFKLDEKIDTSIECDYACLRMRLRLSRLLNYFLLQLYFPTTMIVVVSWVSFWIDSSSTAGRVALAMTTLLTSFTMQTSINAKLPPVNYVKVIDVWLGTCQTFVFGALIEYAVVCYLETGIKAREEKADELRASQKRAKKNGAEPVKSTDYAEVETAQAPCTCQLNEGWTASNSVAATLGILSPAMATFFPLAAGLATGGVAGRLQRSDTPGSCAHRRWSFDSNRGTKRTLWQTFKHKLRKPDYLPARIDYYARIYAPAGFLLFNVIYWSVCFYKASSWEHPTP